LQHVSLGFVALLLNPTYTRNPALMRLTRSTQCMQQGIETSPQ